MTVDGLMVVAVWEHVDRAGLVGAKCIAIQGLGRNRTGQWDLTEA